MQAGGWRTWLGRVEDHIDRVVAEKYWDKSNRRYEHEPRGPWKNVFITNGINDYLWSVRSQFTEGRRELGNKKSGAAKNNWRIKFYWYR